MTRASRLLIETILIIAVILTACKKETTFPDPGNQNGDDPNPDSIYKIRVKAAIRIGNIMYDSIPASLHIIWWDKNGSAHQREVDLLAGTNEISLAASAAKYQLKLSKWGISDELIFTKTEIKEGTLIVLGGSKASKKLRREEGYLLKAGTYQPDTKTIYTYNASGDLKLIEYYQAGPQHDNFTRLQSDEFIYSGNQLEKINRFNDSGLQVGFTDFKYNPEGKVNTAFNRIYDRATAAFIEYHGAGKDTIIKIDYLFINGNTMAYHMTVKAGNNIEDTVHTPLGSSEKGVYTYDLNINPYAHMNWPDLFLSNLSKNNLIDQQKAYIGNTPSTEPYKFIYSYDAEGYPTELIKSYRSYLTREHLSNIKTVYTY